MSFAADMFVRTMCDANERRRASFHEAHREIMSVRETAR